MKEIDPVTRAVELGFHKQGEVSLSSSPQQAFRDGMAEAIRQLPEGELLRMMKKTGLRHWQEALARLIETH